MFYFTLFVASLLAGAWLRLRGRVSGKLVGLDSWDVLLVAKAIRENNMWIPKENPFHAIKNPLDTPPLFHSLVALLPSKNIEYYSKYLSVALDWLNACLIADLVFFFSGSVDAGLLAGVMFMFTPSSVIESMTFSPRSFASLEFTFFLAFLALYSQTLSLVWFCFAIALFVLMAFTHKFTIQAAVVTCLGLAFAYGNDAFSLVIVCGVALAWICWHEGYEAILRGHAAILRFWKHNINKRGLRSVSGSLSKVVVNPWLVFAFIPLLTGVPWVGVNAFFFTVVCVLLAAFVLTSFKSLAFLGENHRYLEYASLPAFALAAQFIVFNPSIATYFLASSCFIGGLIVINQFERALLAGECVEQTPAFVEACRAVKRSKRDVVLCVPDFNSPCAFFSGKKVFTASSPTLWKKEPWLVFRDKLSLREAVKRGVELVLVSRAREAVVARKLDAAGIGKREFFRNKEFAVFEVKEASRKYECR